MKLTEEQYNLIAEYEKDFRHAINDGYFRIVNRKLLTDYAAIYKSVFKKDSKILNGCSRCVLADIKTLAKVYFDDKAEKEAQIDLIEPECATTTTTKTKSATTKKNKKNKKK